MKTLKIAAATLAGLGFVASALASPAPYFAATQAPTVTSIVVFDQPNFKGRSLSFDRSVPSLAKLNFNDVIASVQIKGTRDWVLCEHRNFMGKCVRIRAKEKNLKRLKIDGQVSSLYPVPVPPPAPAKPR
jgi:hypothetical protein